jgi:hypothetical protein
MGKHERIESWEQGQTSHDCCGLFEVAVPVGKIEERPRFASPDLGPRISLDDSERIGIFPEPASCETISA